MRRGEEGKKMRVERGEEGKERKVFVIEAGGGFEGNWWHSWCL